ncbi:helix-turn-helix domain-containing protein [Jiella sp. M17.18]|uniref:helix-turn-helix domain-containing protein n=1 Tax=Jiella sp. M17.18 TaxID=3234247 RepID=UPI0034DFA979
MSDVGNDLVEAFAEIAADLRGETRAQSYEIPSDLMTPERIRAIRRRVASSTRAFEREFHVPARTMEAYEQGRRRPDKATEALLRIIDKEPDAARRALVS